MPAQEGNSVHMADVFFSFLLFWKRENTIGTLTEFTFPPPAGRGLNLLPRASASAFVSSDV